MAKTTQCCGRDWCVGDPCGIVCAVITWLLIFYGQVCVLLVMLHSWDEYTLHTGFNFVVFEILAALSIASHLKTMLTNPGAVPRGTATEENIEKLQKMLSGQTVLKCTKCMSVKPDRSHHCSVCDRCIRRMDHHCPWVNNCVGEGNQKYFVLFTMYVALHSLHALYWGVWHFVLCVGNEWQNCSSLGPPGTTLLLIFLLFEAILFAIFTSVMFGTQLSAICSDETGIESLQHRSDKRSTNSWKNLSLVFGGPFSVKWFNPLAEPYITKPAFELSV